jgi:pyruvate/2-oxoglutarate dehydrogenase complex dihydrolipoamide dehydrogenase (E3) component
MGEARFTGPKSLAVALPDGQDLALAADLIFVNAGARPTIPHVAGIDTVPVLTSTSTMDLDLVPDHLVILGGGYIGLEFGQMGSQVTIVQRGPRFLPREDADIAAAMAGILREDGVDLLLDADASRVEAAGDEVRVTLQTPEGERVLIGSHLLAAAGRTPNTDRLDLAAAGIIPDKHGFIPTNDRLETTVPGVYALGDIKGGPAFTHISYDDFRVVRTNLIDGGNASIAGRIVPYTVFTDPQLGRVGLTEQEARQAGHSIKVATMPMSYVARALEVDESRGLMKAVVAADTGQILGAAVLGIEGGEVMAMLQIAMLGNLPYTTLRDAIFAHPTLAESLNNLFA